MSFKIQYPKKSALKKTFSKPRKSSLRTLSKKKTSLKTKKTYSMKRYKKGRHATYRKHRGRKRNRKFNNPSHEVVVNEGQSGLPDRILTKMVTANHEVAACSGTIEYAFAKGNNINACFTGWFNTSGNNPNGYNEKFDTYKQAIVKASAITIRAMTDDINNEVLGCIMPVSEDQLSVIQTATSLRQLEQLPHCKLFVIKAGSAGYTTMKHYMTTSQVLLNKNKKVDIDPNYQDYAVIEGQAGTVNEWFWFVAFQNVSNISAGLDFQTKLTHYTEWFDNLSSVYFTLPRVDALGNDLPRIPKVKEDEKKVETTVTQSKLTIQPQELEYEMIKVPKLKTPAPLVRT